MGGGITGTDLTDALGAAGLFVAGVIVGAAVVVAVVRAVVRIFRRDV